MRFASITITFVTACGNVASNSDVHTLDAHTLDAGPACDTNKPFGAPVPINGVNSAAWEDGGTISADRLTIYFSSNLPGNRYNIYAASRANVGAPFGTPTPLPNVNIDMKSQISPVLSGDELTLYFGQAPLTGGSYDIYDAIRVDTAGAFGAPQLLLNVNDPNAMVDDQPNWVNAAGTTLYLQSNRGGDPSNLYRATRTSASGPFGTPTPIGELNSGSEDASAVFTADELTVFFYSNRPGTAGCWDIMTATRSTVTDGFGAPSFVTELNTPNCEAPRWVSPDGCDLMLVTNRPGGVGSFDLWLAARPL